MMIGAEKAIAAKCLNKHSVQMNNTGIKMNELTKNESTRTAFEKTRTYSSYCSTLITFNAELNCYVSKEKWREKEAEILTAAWWAFQERQGEVNALNEKLDACSELVKKWKKQGLGGSSDYALGGFHARQDCQDDVIQVLSIEKRDEA